MRIRDAQEILSIMAGLVAWIFFCTWLFGAPSDLRSDLRSPKVPAYGAPGIELKKE